MNFYLLMILMWLGSTPTYATTVAPPTFTDPAQEKIYQALIHELRCLVCQNQTIGDSNAELAQDMRRKTYALIQQGYTKQQVADFMSQRYGDFVLYNPPFNITTAVLWLAPGLLLILALWLLFRYIRQHTSDTSTS